MLNFPFKWRFPVARVDSRTVVVGCCWLGLTENHSSKQDFMNNSKHYPFEELISTQFFLCHIATWFDYNRFFPSFIRFNHLFHPFPALNHRFFVAGVSGFLQPVGPHVWWFNPKSYFQWIGLQETAKTMVLPWNIRFLPVPIQFYRYLPNICRLLAQQFLDLSSSTYSTKLTPSIGEIPMFPTASGAPFLRRIGPAATLVPVWWILPCSRPVWAMSVPWRSSATTSWGGKWMDF